MSSAPWASAGGFPGGSASQGEGDEFSGNVVQVHSQGSKSLPSWVFSVPSGATPEIRSHAYRCGTGCIPVLEWRAIGNEAVRLRAQLRAEAVPELGKGSKALVVVGEMGSISRTKVVTKAILGMPFLVPVSTCFRARAPHLSVAEAGMRSQAQSIGTASLPGAGR